MKDYIRSASTMFCLSLLATCATARAQILPEPGPQGSRIALVIGNSDYGGGENDVSGVNDSEVMAEALLDLKFQVIKETNADFDKMNKRLDKLAGSVENAAVVVVFFSGHGFQTDNENYLIPARGTVDPARSISLAKIRDSLAFATQALKLVFLDACRKNIHAEKPGLSGKKLPPLPNHLYWFATGYDRTAPAGEQEGFSPFTASLVRHIREPGLELGDLLERVSGELKPFDQSPTRDIESDQHLEQFMFHDPVYLGIEVPEDVKNLFVILNGEVVLDSSQESEKAVQLRADRKNDLVLMVSHGRTFNKNHDWDVPNGWSYEAFFISPSGERWDFGDHEDHPFENGPRHGGVFTVAKATILVDPLSGEVSLPRETRDDKVWEHDSPVWAQRQIRLYERSVKNLPLDKILDPQALPNFGAIPSATVALLLREFLTTGKFLNHQISEPERTFFEVWGNEAYGDLVRTCVVENEDDRVKDLQASVVAALRRDPQPFAVFDRELNRCVQDLGERRGLSRDDIRVWTAIDDRSPEPQGTPDAGGQAAGTRNDSTLGGPSHE